MVNSGTTALSIALKAMDIGPGDEVLMPGYFWISCPTSVVLTGAVPTLTEAICDRVIEEFQKAAKKYM